LHGSGLPKELKTTVGALSPFGKLAGTFRFNPERRNKVLSRLKAWD